MGAAPPTPLERAELYAKIRSLTIEEQLGGGQDGMILGTSQKTALKIFLYEQLYRQERDVDLRFRDRKVSQIDRFQLPRVVDFDEVLLIVEMTIVSPPFILDFAGVRLDVPIEFEPEIIAEWLAEKQEQFEVDWPTVRSALV